MDRRFDQNEAVEVTVVCDVQRVPASKVVIQTAIYRVIEVKRAGVKGQFFEPVHVEHCAVEEGFVGDFQDLQRVGDQLRELAVDHANPFDVERDRVEPFVAVRLHFLPGAQNRNGPVADEIVVAV